MFAGRCRCFVDVWREMLMFCGYLEVDADANLLWMLDANANVLWKVDANVNVLWELGGRC
jgi:hypothetical protein